MIRTRTAHGVTGLLVVLSLAAGGCATVELIDEEAGTLVAAPVQSEASGVAGTEVVNESIEEVLPTAAEKRELGADEDPMAVSDVKRDVQRAEDQEGEPTRSTGFDVYGSLRLRYRNEGDKAGFQDSASRLGIETDWQFAPGSFLVGRYEWGFNLITGLDPDKSLGELNGTIFTRLFYVGLDMPGANVIVGKNWSTYYEVAAFTDRFQGIGGKGTGVYNAQTDGGPTGTGRADRTVQGKLSMDFLPHKVFKPFDLNVQVQHGNYIPFGNGADYGTALGASAVMNTKGNFSLGLAFNHASIDLNENPSLQDIGLNGPARAMLLGTRAFGDRWYAGFTVSKLDNHETTDEGIYFDGWGSEFYGQYRVVDNWWFVGGYSLLEPDSDQTQAGDYRVRFGMLGVRYTFDVDDFGFMLWGNVRLNDSINQNGVALDNVYTVGFRWDLGKRGWRVSK